MNETIAVNSFGEDYEDDLCNGLKDGNIVSVPLSDGGIGTNGRSYKLYCIRAPQILLKKPSNSELYRDTRVIKDIYYVPVQC